MARVSSQNWVAFYLLDLCIQYCLLLTIRCSHPNSWLPKQPRVTITTCFGYKESSGVSEAQHCGLPPARHHDYRIIKAVRDLRRCCYQHLDTTQNTYISSYPGVHYLFDFLTGDHRPQILKITLSSVHKMEANVDHEEHASEEDR